VKAPMRNVKVLKLPDSLAHDGGQTFRREFVECLDHNRPRIVLECSALRHVDQKTLYLLLCSLEEAMKRNGDVKLAALPAEAKTAMASGGLDRVFRIFDTTAEAVESYRHYSSLDSHVSLESPHDNYDAVTDEA